MVGLWIWLLSTVAVVSAGHHAIVVRPLRIYTQNATAAKEAGAALSLYFNVSLHHNLHLSCDQLISTAQKYGDATPVVIVSKKSGRCPSDLWSGAFLVDLSSGTVDWPSYADKLSQNPEVPPSKEMYKKEQVYPTTEIAETTTTEATPAGLRLAIWIFVLMVIAIVLLLLAVGVLGWLVWKKKSTKDVEKGNKTEKPVGTKTALPPPQEKKTTSGKEKSSKRSTRSTRSQRSPSTTSESSKKDKKKKSSKKKIENCSTREEERSETERAKATKKPADHPKEGSEICQLRSDQAELIPEPAPPPQRTLDKRLDEPVTKEEFLYTMLKLTKQMVEYCEDSLIYPVTTTEKPGFLFKRFQGDVPKEPGNLQTIQEMTEFIKGTILPGMTHCQHPRFHSYFACGRSYPDILAEMLLASLGVVGSTWEACPALVEMEYSMVNWVGKALGLPKAFLFNENIGQSVGGGSFVETSTEAILSTVLAARQWKIRELAGKALSQTDMEGVHYDLETMHDQAKKLVFYASREAHSSMEKSCKLAMVRCRSVATWPDHNWKMTASHLEQNIMADQKKGLVPTYVLVTLGTTTTGACDDLAGIVEVAKRHNLYVHVDAASSGIFWIDPKYRNNCKGLEGAHSLNVSLHKAMLQSASAAVLFTRDKNILLNAMAITPEYSPPPASPDASGIVDLRDWGLLSSRKFKALKSWFVLKFYGLEGIRRYLKNAVEMSDYFMTKVQDHPNLKIFSKSPYGQFCFQFVGDTNWTRQQKNTATSQLARHLNQSTKLLVTPAVVGGNNVIRIATSFERTPKWSVDDTFSTMCDLIDESKQSMTQLPENVVECRPVDSVILYRKREEGGLVGSANLVTDQTPRSTSEMVSLEAAEPSSDRQVAPRSNRR